MSQESGVVKFERGAGRFLAGLLIAVGALFGTLSGGCTLYFLSWVGPSNGISSDERAWGTFVLWVGGVVFIPSLLVLLLGIGLWRLAGIRRAKAAAETPTPPA